MRLQSRLFAAATACALLGAASVGRAAFTSADTARVGFAASGPAGMKIEGTTSELKVAETDGHVVVGVALGSLTTGIALRDQHMREKYLEVSKYPEAILSIARSALRVPAAGGDRLAADAPGTLKLHGQSRPVTVHYEASPDASGVAVNGRFHLRMDDFGIAIPSYLGVSVKPDVDVTATFHVTGS